MNEMTKTGIFAGSAVVALLLAFFAAPRGPGEPDIAEEEKRFFAEFKPQDATSLEIIEYDEDTSTVHPFKVARADGVWSIPSHQNYPADAERQLAEAAASVVDLEKLGFVSNDKSDHVLYGVVDPDPKEVQGGAEGVGMRVALEDKNGKKLANFIIGKEVKDQTGLRYVRVPGQDAVFRVAIQPDKLSTKFEDWIEKDLLKINTFDIKELTLNNYSIDELNGRIVPGDVLELEYDNSDSKWKLDGLKPGEELVADKLNDLKTALDDLKIIDVRRKPSGLGRELKQQEGMQLTAQDVQDLASKGFYIVQGQLLSNEGEVICRMKDGVVYVLRFGEIAANTGGIRKDEKKPEAGESEEATDAADKTEGEKPSGANRYIFVTAQLDPKLIPEPDLQPLPVVTQPEAGDATDKTDAAKDTDKATPAAKPDGDAATESDDADQPADGEQKQPSDNDASDDNAAAQPAEQQPEKPKPADDISIEAFNKLKQEGAKGEEKPIVTEEDRKAVEKENQHKQDEYDEKIKKGQERVQQLNARFADWYYVISDEEYRKIHLSRADIVKQAETKPEEGTPSSETPSKTPEEEAKTNE